MAVTDTSRTENPERLSVASIINRSFSIWFRNLPAFVILSAVAESPYIGYTYYTNFVHAGAGSIRLYKGLDEILPLIFSSFAEGAIAYGVLQQLIGRTAEIGDSIRVGMRGFLPVLGVAIVYTVATGIGFQFFMILGIIVACMLAVAVPVAITENLGVIGSLTRSIELTRGEKGPIFGVFLFINLISFIATTGTALGVLIVTRDESAVDPGRTLPWVIVILQCLLFGALQAVASVVIYHDLRVCKEGATSEELARAFTEARRRD